MVKKIHMKHYLNRFLLGLTLLPSLSFAMPVYPTEVSGLQSYEFGELIKLYMQDTNAESPNNDWFFNSENPNFNWKTNGVEITEAESPDYPNLARRSAIIRMNFMGKFPQILGNRKEELAWSIDYTAPNDERFGVEAVEIQPYELGCFGTLGLNCTLKPFESLSNANITYKKICENILVSSQTEGYELSAEGKKTLYLVYDYSEGSGGSMTLFTIKFKPEKLCE